MNSKILLLAGNYDQARTYARENNLSIGQWVYVVDADRIRGITNPDVRRIGTYYKRNDIREIEYVIAQYSNRDIEEVREEKNE